MWERLSVNLNLRISFGVLAFLLICVGIISTIYLNNTVKTFQHVSKINLANVITLGKIDTTANHLQLNLLQMSLSDHPQAIKELDEKIKILFNDFDKSQKIYSEIPFVEGKEDLYNESEKGILEITKAMGQLDQAHALNQVSQTLMSTIEGRN